MAAQFPSLRRLRCRPSASRFGLLARQEGVSLIGRVILGRLDAAPRRCRSTTMDSFQIGTLAVYLIAVVTIGLWTKRRESTGDFLIANRSAGVVLTTASISALAGGSVLAVDTELGFVYGLGTLWLPAGGAAALALLGFLAGRIRRLADEHGFLTLTDYLFLRFGAPTGYLGFVLQFAGFLFLLAVQFIVGGRLFAALAPIEYPVAVVVMGVVTMAYLLLGGFKAVMRTDLLQFALMFLVFVVLVPVKANFTELDLELNFGSPGPVRSLSFFLSALGGFVRRCRCLATRVFCSERPSREDLSVSLSGRLAGLWGMSSPTRHCGARFARALRPKEPFSPGFSNCCQTSLPASPP